MKIIHIVLIFLLTACGASASALSAGTNAPQATQSLSTPSKIPTATVGYQQTAIVAQATADEARRMNVQATIEYQKVLQAQIQTTVEAEQRSFQKLSWTATAALTSVPLTSTAQVDNSTAIARQQVILSGMMTGTAQAPTQIIAMQRARDEVKQAPLDFIVRMFFFLAMSFGFICVGVFALSNRPQIQKPQSVTPADFKPIPETAQTVITLKTDHGAGFAKTERMVIPCTPEQFTRLVSGVLHDNTPLAYKFWISADSPFVREEYTAVREFMQANGWAQGSGTAGTLELTAKGEAVFIGWLDTQSLPEAYRFKEDDAVNQQVSEEE